MRAIPVRDYMAICGSDRLPSFRCLLREHPHGCLRRALHASFPNSGLRYTLAATPDVAFRDCVCAEASPATSDPEVASEPSRLEPINLERRDLMVNERVNGQDKAFD